MKKLLTTLKAQPADNCAILTYNADLLFFEQLLFEPLYAAGCRNTFVICDPVQYRQALADVPLLRHAGQRYLFLPGNTSPTGAFHPKLILLTNQESGSLFITSGNLTRAGYTHNWEVLTEFVYNSKRPDPGSGQACRWAYNTLASIVATSSDTYSFLQPRLDQLRGTTPWLDQEISVPQVQNVWCIHNLAHSLLKQTLALYREMDGSVVREAIVVSPFFDAGAEAIASLLTSFKPEHFSLYTQALDNGLSPRRLLAILQQQVSSFHSYVLNLNDRRLHAKAVAIRTEKGIWLVTGSANFSRPAWLEIAGGGNTETVVVRFEPQPDYFDTWLDELRVHASPLHFDWDIEAATSSEPPLARPAIDLIAAVLDGPVLYLSMTKVPGGKTSLRIHFLAEDVLSFTATAWQVTSDHSLAVPVPEDILKLLVKPLQVTITFVSNEAIVWSNPVLLHNTEMLARFSRPVRRQDRPSIPEGLGPESYEQYAQLIEMLYGLLASNRELLNRHYRGRIQTISEQVQKEQGMETTNDGDYNPEDYFVPERIQPAVTTTTADLYTDFYDRLTYEDLWRIIMKTVYRPDTLPGTGSDEVGDQIAPPPPPPPNLLQIKERLFRGCQRLVNNFSQGAIDLDYLVEIPSVYFGELFVVIATYLRLLFRNAMLDNDHFVELSLKLLIAFWGHPTQLGAWSIVAPRLTEEEGNRLNQQLLLAGQSYLHIYAVVFVLWQELESNKDRRLYDLALWLRFFSRTQSMSQALREMTPQMYQRLWQSSFPAEVPVLDVTTVISELKAIQDLYDAESLRIEINGMPGARAVIRDVDTADLKVPELHVDLPLTEDKLDWCFRYFLLFLTQPQPRRLARATFVNVNPTIQDNDLQRFVLFYRGDEQSLLVAAERHSGKYQPDIDKVGVRIESLRTISSLTELD